MECTLNGNDLEILVHYFWLQIKLNFSIYISRLQNFTKMHSLSVYFHYKKNVLIYSYFVKVFNQLNKLQITYYLFTLLTKLWYMCMSLSFCGTFCLLQYDGFYLNWPFWKTHESLEWLVFKVRSNQSWEIFLLRSFDNLLKAA